MIVLKFLERIGKVLGALIGAALLSRPWRSRTRIAGLARARRFLVVRLDNRVGEALLTTPVLASLKALHSASTVEVAVHRSVARVLDGHPAIDRLHVVRRGELWLGPLSPVLRTLRRARFDIVLNSTNWSAPSVSGTLFSRLAGPYAAVVGPDGFWARMLQSRSVPPAPALASEVDQRLRLLAPVAGVHPVREISFRAPRPGAAFQAYLHGLGAPIAVVNPGGRLGGRRVEPLAFAHAASALVGLGRRPIVTWGPGEEALAREVVNGAPGALLAPATDLDELAALMVRAGLTVCNNTGPMHLSVAVGAPTLALFARMPASRWGHAYAPHRMVDVTELLDTPERLFEAVGRETTRFTEAINSKAQSQPGAALGEHRSQ